VSGTSSLTEQKAVRRTNSTKKRLLGIACSMGKCGQEEEEKGKVRQKEQTALHAQ